MHIVLLGDSVFYNAPYVPAGGEVISKLRSLLDRGSQATLNAIDGSFIAGVANQLRRVPLGASHLVVSAGGNDALAHSGVLREQAESVGGALLKVAAVQRMFRREYAAMLDATLKLGLPITVCT